MFPTQFPTAPQAPKSVMTLREIDKTAPENAHLMDRFNSGRNAIARVATTVALPNIAVTCTNNGFIQVIDMASGVYRLFVVDLATKTYIDLPPRCLAIDPTPGLVSAAAGAENIGVKEIALIFAPAYSPSVVHASTLTGDVHDLINLRSRPSAVSTDGDFAVAGDASCEACAWRTGTYSLLWRTSLTKDSTSASIINILQHRETCFFSLSNSTVVVCSVRTGNILTTLLGDSSPLAGVVPTPPFADAVIVASNAGSLTVWAPPLKNLGGNASGSVAPQATSLAAVPDNYAGQNWQILSVTNTDMLIKSVSMQNGFLAIGGSDGRVALFDASKIAISSSKGKTKLPMLCCFDLEHPILHCGVGNDNHFSIVTSIGDVWRWPIEKVLPENTNPNTKKTSFNHRQTGATNRTTAAGYEYDLDEGEDDDGDAVYDENDQQEEGENEDDDDDDDYENVTANHHHYSSEDPPHQSNHIPTPDTSREGDNMMLDYSSTSISQRNNNNSNKTNQNRPTARRLSTDDITTTTTTTTTRQSGLPPLPTNNNGNQQQRTSENQDDDYDDEDRHLLDETLDDLADSDIVLNNNNRNQQNNNNNNNNISRNHSDIGADSDFGSLLGSATKKSRNNNANMDEEDGDEGINTSNWKQHRDPLGDTQQPGLAYASATGAQEWYENKNKETVIMMDDGEDEDDNSEQQKNQKNKNNYNNQQSSALDTSATGLLPVPSGKVPQPTPSSNNLTPSFVGTNNGSNSTPSSRGSQLRSTPASSNTRSAATSSGTHHSSVSSGNNNNNHNQRGRSVEGEEEEEEFEEVSPGTATTQTTSSAERRQQEAAVDDDDEENDADNNGGIVYHHRKPANMNNNNQQQGIQSPAKKQRLSQEEENRKLAKELQGLSYGKRMNPKATDAFLQRAVQLQQGRETADGNNVGGAGDENSNRQQQHPLASVTPQISKFLKEAERDNGKGPNSQVVLQREDLEDFDLQEYADKHRTLVAALEHKHAIKLQNYKRDDVAFYAEELMMLKDNNNNENVETGGQRTVEELLMGQQQEDEQQEENNDEGTTPRHIIASTTNNNNHNTLTSPKSNNSRRQSPNNNNRNLGVVNNSTSSSAPFLKNITNTLTTGSSSNGDDLMPATSKRPLVRRVDPVYERQKKLAGPQLHDHLCSDLLIPPMPSSVFFNDKVSNPKEPKSLVLPLPLPSTPLAF